MTTFIFTHVFCLQSGCEEFLYSMKEQGFGGTMEILKSTPYEFFKAFVAVDENMHNALQAAEEFGPFPYDSSDMR